jgi:galactose oxidase-like protein
MTMTTMTTDGASGTMGNSRQDTELRVTAPRLQGQAVPGIYMLFVVDRNGTPSEGRRVDIRPDTRGNNPRFK